jgi:membrane-associated phospholipid phosphatase
VHEAIGREGDDSRTWASAIRPLGQEGGLGLAFLAWSAGKATGHDEISAIGEDSLEATIVAAGFVTPLLKLAVGRDRPRSGHPSESFSGGAESFPSGEVTEAFAMASVIAAHSRRRWVDALAWGAAGSIAWERLRLDAHWASDVTAGALIGAGIGRWVVRRNHPRVIERSSGELSSFWKDWSVTPLIGQKDFGLGVHVTF